MLGDEQFKEMPSGGGGGASGDGGGFGRKNYLRSASWTDRSPRKSTPGAKGPFSNNKARLGIPSLPPLSISKRTIEEWPRAGSDDLGVWPQAPTPGAKGPPKLPQGQGFEIPEREFEFKKDKLAFFDKDCSRIIDHVYLGSDAVAKNLEVLRENKITHVLNCVGFVCPEYFKDDFGYKTLWLRDSPTEDITSILYDVFDYFEDVREQGGRVFVHCCQGVSRSTSLVIAYRMWREKQSFEEAFQYVKAARGVTNPNMGFACQLMLCRNRALAILASPDSVLRMYRMAPHSPYDPLHLVPKMLSKPGVRGLDSRGAFVIHAPLAVYVWIGKDCVSVMSDSARSAAHQVVRYELAQGPVITVKEGEEQIEFQEALSNKQMETIEEENENLSDDDELSTWLGLNEKRVGLYNQDFEIFHRALEGGVIPPVPLSGAISETCLPARESGWGRLRRRFSSGIMKELIMSAKLFSDDAISNNGSITVDFSFCSSDDSPIREKTTCKEGEHNDPQTDTLPSPTYSSSSQDSFSSYLINNSPKSDLKSPAFSPTTSDRSSSFTFSPSSSKWSDFSCLSPQTSLSGLESPHHEQNDCLQCKEKSLNSPKKAFSCDHVCKAADDNKANANSISRVNLVPLMVLPSTDEVSLAQKNLGRSWSFSLSNLDEDADMFDASDEVLSDVEVENCSPHLS